MACLAIRRPPHERHRVRPRATTQHNLARANAGDQDDPTIVLDRPAVVLRVVQELLAIGDLCPDAHEQAKAIPVETLHGVTCLAVQLPSREATTQGR
jgi:hypothetical protein